MHSLLHVDSNSGWRPDTALAKLLKIVGGSETWKKRCGATDGFFGDC